MLFSSLLFLQIFLPLTLAAYYAVHLFRGISEAQERNYKNTVLLIASLVFYGFGGIKYLFLMLAVIGINYFGGFAVRPARKGEKGSRPALVIVLILNLSLLFFFKYFNLFTDSLLAFVRLFRKETEWNLIRVVLPIGISFYIFQALSYVIDVYRGQTGVRKQFRDFALYIACFPQLIAGPIVQYSDVAAQISRRRETLDEFTEGIRRFLYGLAKKVLIANTMAEVADSIWALPVKGIGAGLAWMGMLAYTFQIYFDFSGYSDMAIGLGHMFGFRFKENFNYPYISASVQEFWRRWHISLSSWFRDYVYIPLGGSRCETRKIYRNLIIVFFLTGVWHGANWTFFAWGLYHGLFLILERAFLGEKLKKWPKVLTRLYTMLEVMIGWILFRSDSLGQALQFIGQLFARRTVDETVISFLSMRVIIIFAAAVLGSGLIQKLFTKLAKNRTAAWLRIPERCFLLAMLVLCILSLISNSYNPFIYFQF